MFRIALFVSFSLMCAPVLAESVGEKTGIDAFLGITPSSEDFVTEAAQSDMFEVESGRLAQENSQDAAIKDFARQMITDHTKSSGELRARATAINIPVPVTLAVANQGELTKLRGLSSSDFDNRYVSDQVNGHKSAVSLFTRYAKGGDNTGLKSWAAGLLPTLQHHLDMAHNLKPRG